MRGRFQMAEGLRKHGSHRLAEDSRVRSAQTGKGRSKLHPMVRPIQSGPAPQRLCRKAVCPGASIWINSTGSLRFICVQFLPCSPRDQHLQGWQEYSSACQEKTLWGRLAHSISPTQVGMEMEQGAHRQNRVGALSPNPSIPGVLLLSAVPENLKQRSKRAGET